MNREEQKFQAASDYIKQRIKEGQGQTGDVFPAYIEGIEWADEHPIGSPPEKPISKDLEEAAMMHYKDVMEYEMKTGLKPAHITSFKVGAKWEEERLIKKACEWLKEQNEMVGISFQEDLITRFKNYMKGE